MSKFEVFIGTSDQLPAEFEVVDSISSPGSVESSEHSQSAEREVAAAAGGEIMDSPPGLPSWDNFTAMNEVNKKKMWDSFISMISNLQSTVSELKKEIADLRAEKVRPVKIIVLNVTFLSYLFKPRKINRLRRGLWTAWTFISNTRKKKKKRRTIL